MSFDEGALLEPLSVGVHACQRAGVKLGSNVLVCGAGPIGLVCMLTAKASGASKVIMTGRVEKYERFSGCCCCCCRLADIDEGRLKAAKEMGATYTVKVTTRDSRALAKEIEATLGCQPDHTLECSGAEPSIATAIYVSIVACQFMLSLKSSHLWNQCELIRGVTSFQGIAGQA